MKNEESMECWIDFGEIVCLKYYQKGMSLDESYLYIILRNGREVDFRGNMADKLIEKFMDRHKET